MLATLAHAIPRNHCWTLGASGSSADLIFDAASRLDDEFHLPALLARESIDVFHSPLFQIPACMPCRSVITIHDAIPSVRPDLTPPLFARLFDEARDAARWADRIVCPSEHAKADVAKALDIPTQRIVVVPECPAPHFRPSSEQEKTAVRARFELEGEFFLVVGSIERRKNPSLVLDALATLPSARAVFVGPEAGFDLATEAKRRGIAACVRALGHVADSDLVALYGAAEALLFPSLYEGFGLPIIEAFACETPVMCSRASSLPGVAGDAAILFDPKEAGALVAAVEELRGSAERCAELVARGRARLQLYSPEAVRLAFAALYDGLEADSVTAPEPALAASEGRS